MLRKFLLVIFWLSTYPALAQTEVRATVNYPAVNLRDAPRADQATRWSGTGNILAVLSLGEEVMIEAVETLDTYPAWRAETENTWVYVHVPDRHLSGWVVSEYLRFDQADWLQHVHQITTWEELLEYTSLRLSPDGIPGTVVNVGGTGLLYYPLFQTPLDQTVTTYIPLDTPITVLGRAEVAGQTSPYLYIRSNDGQYSGWLDYSNFGEVISDQLFKGVTSPTLAWFQVLPVIFVSDAPIVYPYGVVNNSNVNLRSAPDLNAPIVREMSYDTHLTLHSTTSYDQETAWLYVTVASTGESGWVSARFVGLWVTAWYGSRHGGQLESLPLTQP